jgi:manganese/iron transport system substrate-binding protein
VSVRPVGRLLALLATAALAGCVAACGSADGSLRTLRSGAGGALRVVATTTQVADIARNIGGARIVLTPLLKANVDPHDYEASPADILAIAEADVVVKNGVGLEHFLDDAISSAGFTGTVVDASAGVPIRPGSAAGEEQGDPHVWHDPRNAAIMARNIADAFAATDPAGRAVYQANYRSYAGRLAALDTDIQRKIASIPAERRKLVTNHDAFGYYVARYRLQFIGSIIPSFDTSAELSGKDISELVAKIKASGAAAIFSETSLSPKTADTIGREAGVRVVQGESALYGDTLGPPGSGADTYLTMEEHNTDTIVSALRG